MSRKALTLLAAMFLVIGLVAGCGGSNTGASGSENSAGNVGGLAGEVRSRVKQSGVLRVGLEGTYPPFNYVDANGQMAGFDVDISNEIAKRLGVKTQFVGTEWKSLIGGLQADKFDVIIAQMSITEERKKSVDFTDPYVISGAVLISRQGDNRFHKLEDIKGAKVGVGLGTTFEKLARSVEGADVRTYDSFEQYSGDLLNKRLDVIINDQLTAAYAIKSKHLPLQISSDVLTEDHIGIAVKKGNQDFVDALNKILKDMLDDGTYRKIFMKWFDVEPALK